jgi:hypothetical protein
MDEHTLYSVYQFFEDGTHERVRHLVPATQAVMAAHHYTHSIAARYGFVEKVIITTDDDDCCFEWRYREGIVYPDECRRQS